MDQKESEIIQSFGKKLKAARKNSKYTQEKLAEKLSLSSRFISKIERGLSLGSATTLVNICNALDISPNYLFNDFIKNDVIKSTSQDKTKLLEEYSQLNDSNKRILHTMITALLNEQLCNDFTNNNNKSESHLLL